MCRPVSYSQTIGPVYNVNVVATWRAGIVRCCDCAEEASQVPGTRYRATAYAARYRIPAMQDRISASVTHPLSPAS